eukprot:SAG22_NODE_10797_length_515_cov_3.247596_1_plen_112_part_10
MSAGGRDDYEPGWGPGKRKLEEEDPKDIEKMRYDLGRYKWMFDDLREENDQKAKEIDRLVKEVQKLKEEVQKLKEEVQKLKLMRTEKGEYVKTIETLKGELGDLAKENDELR